MSDTVIVALITTVGSILVATLTQVVSVMNGAKATNGDSREQLKKENKQLRKQNEDLQQIVDFYRKKEKK